MAESYVILPLAKLELLMPLSNTPDLQRFLSQLTSRSVLTDEEQQAILDLPGKSQLVQANRDFVCLEPS